MAEIPNLGVWEQESGSDFYRDRDKLNGGTDNVWVEAGSFNQWHSALDDIAAPGPAGIVDQRADDDTRFSDVLSQSDLAS